MSPDRPDPPRRAALGRLRRAWFAAWDEPAPAGAPVRVWRDWALVAVLVPAIVIEGLLRPDLPWRWLQVAAALLLVPTLLWRRTHPLLPVVATTSVSTAMMLIMGQDGELVTAVFGAVLIYALFRWGSGRGVVVGAALLGAALALTWTLGHSTGGDLVGGASVVALLGATGLAVRFRVTARQRALTQARAQERERIARDMHDLVGHHVSGIAVRAQAGLAQAAARRVGSHTDADDPLEAALRVIETEARDTLVEMRALVRVLREDEQGPDGPAGPAGTSGSTGTAGTTPAQLPTSPTDPGAGLARSTGIPGPGPQASDVVRLASGPPSAVVVTVCGEIGAVRPDVGAAAFRIAQESVTNARRHAREATSVQVRLTVEPLALRLSVADDGAGPTPQSAPGNGIEGMRARAEELGGEVTAGPDPAGGWTVEAVLPLTGGHP